MKIGIYQTYWGPVGGGQRYVAVVAELLAQEHDVEIVHHCEGFNVSVIEERMQVDLSGVRFRYLPPIERPNWTTNNPLRRLELEKEVGREVSEPYDLFIDSSDVPPFFNHARRGALLIHFPLVTFEEYHGRPSSKWKTRSRLKRLISGIYQRVEWKRRFGSYDIYLVNSKFTKVWTKRFWGLEAQVVFPPLRDGLAPQQKRQAILSIGAFRSEQHKKQTVTIQAFKELCDAGLSGWTYIMMGASGPTEDDQRYFQSLCAAAEGYPIEFMNDATGLELKERLEAASILWHSMGYGVDENREPRRMEHFGMVATEAMAAGCVPIVFNGGGLREIVEDGKTGFLWSSPEELKRQTLTLVNDEDKMNQMSVAAVEDSGRFSGAAFASRLKSALDAVLDSPIQQSLQKSTS